MALPADQGLLLPWLPLALQGPDMVPAWGSTLWWPPSANMGPLSTLSEDFGPRHPLAPISKKGPAQQPAWDCFAQGLSIKIFPGFTLPR